MKQKKKESVINKKIYLSSWASGISDTYEEIKKYKHKLINCSCFLANDEKLSFCLNPYNEECNKKIEELTKKFTDDFKEYKKMIEMDEEELTAYLSYKDKKAQREYEIERELDL